MLKNVYKRRRKKIRWLTKQRSYRIRNVSGRNILAEADSHIMGLVSLYLPENFIHHLFVHPDFSGKGVGGQLIKASIEKMGKPLRLKCVSENHKAIKFYENNGWKKVIEEGKPGGEYWVMEYE